MSVTSTYQFHRATGAGVLNEDWNPGSGVVIHSIKLALDAAGGAAEDFTCTIDSATGAAYDLRVLTQDMNTTQWVLQTYGIGEFVVDKDDVIEFDYANTNSRTWGLEVVYSKLTKTG